LKVSSVIASSSLFGIIKEFESKAIFSVDGSIGLFIGIDDKALANNGFNEFIFFNFLFSSKLLFNRGKVIASFNSLS